jgi:hypothetical protein
MCLDTFVVFLRLAHFYFTSRVERVQVEQELEFRTRILQQQLDMKKEMDAFLASNSKVLNEVRDLLERSTKVPS